jgi:hypothetical protein
MSGVWTLREAQEGYSAQQWPQFYDPYYLNVVLVLDFEGSFADQSVNAYTVTANSGASISSGTSAIGTRSGLFVSSSSQYASVSGGLASIGLSPLIFGTNNFCLEAWVYPTSYTRSSQSVRDFDSDYFLISNDNGGLFISNSDSARFGGAQFYNNQSGTVSVAGANNAVPVNAWTHIAYAREGSTGRLFVNGVQVATGTDATDYSSAHSLIGGRTFNNDSRYFNGYLDGVRITKGVARYTRSFTPPRVLLRTDSAASSMLRTATLTSGGGSNSWRWQTNGFFEATQNSGGQFIVGKYEGTQGNSGWRTTWSVSPKPPSVASAVLTIPADGRYGTPFAVVVKGANLDNASGGLTGSSATTSSVNSTSTGDLVADVTAIVNEIISRPGWVSGNSLVFYLLGDNALSNGDNNSWRQYSDTAGSLTITW